jgi:CopG family nickel-responsive transcriptional regulator
MGKLVRFGISVEESLLESFDSLIEEKGYTNRSEAIRDLMRNTLVETEWRNEKASIVGTITLVFNHHQRELQDKLTKLQHKNYASIIANLHVHLDSHNCLEVLLVKGKAGQIKKLAEYLTAIRGVRHSQLTMTSMGIKL